LMQLSGPATPVSTPVFPFLPALPYPPAVISNHGTLYTMWPAIVSCLLRKISIRKDRHFGLSGEDYSAK
jgi:hypothetical protein